MGVQGLSRHILKWAPYTGSILTEPSTCHCLYLDYNCIIHPLTASATEQYAKDNDNYLVDYLIKVVELAGPSVLLYISVDGIAPIGKVLQQRSRRITSCDKMSTSINCSMLDLISTSGSNNYSTNKEDKFSRIEISPHTPYMKRLSHFMHNIIPALQKTIWSHLTVIFSGPEVPGEGEHKIMSYLRSIEKLNPKMRSYKHVVFGADADLILLTIATHLPNIHVMRDAESNVIMKKGKLMFIGHSDDMPLKPEFKDRNFITINISTLKKYILKSSLEYSPNITDYQAILDDFILISSFMGNDFLPSLPFRNTTREPLTLLLYTYFNLIKITNTTITYNNKIDMYRLDQYMQLLDITEKYSFQEASINMKSTLEYTFKFINENIDKLDQKQNSSLELISNNCNESKISILELIKNSQIDAISNLKKESVDVTTHIYDINTHDKFCTSSNKNIILSDRDSKDLFNIDGTDSHNIYDELSATKSNNDSENIKYNDSENIKYNDSENIKYNDSENIKNNDSENIKYNDSKNIKYNDSENIKYNGLIFLSNLLISRNHKASNVDPIKLIENEYLRRFEDNIKNIAIDQIQNEFINNICNQHNSSSTEFNLNEQHLGSKYNDTSKVISKNCKMNLYRSKLTSTIITNNTDKNTKISLSPKQNRSQKRSESLISSEKLPTLNSCHLRENINNIKESSKNFQPDEYEQRDIKLLKILARDTSTLPYNLLANHDIISVLEKMIFSISDNISSSKVTEIIGSLLRLGTGIDFRCQFQGFRRDEYLCRKLCCTSRELPEMVRLMRFEYIRGIIWNFQYYTLDCPSWTWYYPFSFAPFVCDLLGVDTLSPTRSISLSVSKEFDLHNILSNKNNLSKSFHNESQNNQVKNPIKSFTYHLDTRVYENDIYNKNSLYHFSNDTKYLISHNEKSDIIKQKNTKSLRSSNINYNFDIYKPSKEPINTSLNLQNDNENIKTSNERYGQNEKSYDDAKLDDMGNSKKLNDSFDVTFFRDDNHNFIDYNKSNYLNSTNSNIYNERDNNCDTNEYGLDICNINYDSSNLKKRQHQVQLCSKRLNFAEKKAENCQNSYTVYETLMESYNNKVLPNVDIYVNYNNEIDSNTVRSLESISSNIEVYNDKNSFNERGLIVSQHTNNEYDKNYLLNNYVKNNYSYFASDNNDRNHLNSEKALLNQVSMYNKYLYSDNSKKKEYGKNYQSQYKEHPSPSNYTIYPRQNSVLEYDINPNISHPSHMNYKYLSKTDLSKEKESEQLSIYSNYDKGITHPKRYHDSRTMIKDSYNPSKPKKDKITDYKQFIDEKYTETNHKSFSEYNKKSSKYKSCIYNQKDNTNCTGHKKNTNIKTIMKNNSPLTNFIMGGPITPQELLLHILPPKEFERCGLSKELYQIADADSEYIDLFPTQLTAVPNGSPAGWTAHIDTNMPEEGIFKEAITEILKVPEMCCVNEELGVYLGHGDTITMSYPLIFLPPDLISDEIQQYHDSNKKKNYVNIYNYDNIPNLTFTKIGNHIKFCEVIYSDVSTASSNNFIFSEEFDTKQNLISKYKQNFIYSHNYKYSLNQSKINRKKKELISRSTKRKYSEILNKETMIQKIVLNQLFSDQERESEIIKEDNTKFLNNHSIDFFISELKKKLSELHHDLYIKDNKKQKKGIYLSKEIKDSNYICINKIYNMLNIDKTNISQYCSYIINQFLNNFEYDIVQVYNSYSTISNNIHNNLLYLGESEDKYIANTNNKNLINSNYKKVKTQRIKCHYRVLNLKKPIFRSISNWSFLKKKKNYSKTLSQIFLIDIDRQINIQLQVNSLLKYLYKQSYNIFYSKSTLRNIKQNEISHTLYVFQTKLDSLNKYCNDLSLLIKSRMFTQKDSSVRSDIRKLWKIKSPSYVKSNYRKLSRNQILMHKLLNIFILFLTKKKKIKILNRIKKFYDSVKARSIWPIEKQLYIKHLNEISIRDGNINKTELVFAETSNKNSNCVSNIRQKNKPNKLSTFQNDYDIIRFMKNKCSLDNFLERNISMNDFKKVNNIRIRDMRDSIKNIKLINHFEETSFFIQASPEKRVLYKNIFNSLLSSNFELPDIVLGMLLHQPQSNELEQLPNNVYFLATPSSTTKYNSSVSAFGPWLAYKDALGETGEYIALTASSQRSRRNKELAELCKDSQKYHLWFRVELLQLRNQFNEIVSTWRY